MALHRKVSTLGIVVASLTVGVAAIGWAGLRTQVQQSTSLVAHNNARALLGAAEQDIEQSQIQLQQVLGGKPSTSSTASLQKLITQQTLGIQEWSQYRGPRPRLGRVARWLSTGRRRPEGARTGYTSFPG